MNQHYLIDDVDEPELTPDQINRRVDDWLKRLNDLFAAIKTWAKANRWTAWDGAPVLMLEEPMRRVGAAERRQPSVFVKSPNDVEIWIRPKALWVIGANGRVDVFSSKGTFALVDVADQFESPHWVLHRLGDGTEGEPFAPELLARMT